MRRVNVFQKKSTAVKKQKTHFPQTHMATVRTPISRLLTNNYSFEGVTCL